MDLRGSIDLGEASLILRWTIRDLVESSRTKIILNFREMNSMDSARKWRTGWCLRAGEAWGRRAQVFESNEKEFMGAADHLAGQNCRSVYGRTNSRSQLFLNDRETRSETFDSFGFPSCNMPRLFG